MKKIISIFTSVLIMLGMVISPAFSVTDSKAAETEMRAAWISTVYNIDWPSKSSYGNAEKQKKEYIALLDKLKGAGINTVVVQVRPESDAIYRSKINPWSRFLTGTQGKDPGYDPLAFIVQESHKRGMKVHAWFNPYRASVYSDKSSSASSNAINKHPDWVIKYENKWYYDPGKPEVVNYIVDTVAEVVQNYDVDGVHFDDYFYPGPAFPDDATFKKYGSGNKDNWRRSNINNMIKRVRDKVHSIKPNVEFGVSPAGIWRNSYNDPNGSKTSGGESYIKQYADTRYWIKNGLIDYVVPQVYWRIGHPKADYATLVKWWSDQVKGTNVKLYIGQGIYKHGQSDYGGENVAKEIKQQILLNRRYPEIKGSIFFSAKDIVNQPQVYNDLKSLYLDSSNTGVALPDGVRLPYQNVLMGRDRADTAIEISKKGWENGASEAILVNGKDTISGVVASPLASSLNAPILLKYPSSISDATINEMKRLNIKKITLIGNEDTINQNDIDKITNAIPGITVEKIFAENPQEISTNIAQIIEKNTSVDTAYIASENAMADVLSVAPKAGSERNPIIITDKDSISDNNKEWIKSNNLKNIYVIGGSDTISDSLVNEISSLAKPDTKVSRISGTDRVETNTAVIEKLYNKKFTQKAFIARSSAPIDAITVSALAQRTDSPVILAGNSVSQYQKNVLEPRSASLVYKVGGQINTNTYNMIYNLLGGVMSN